MRQYLARYWWVIGTRGGLAIAFAVMIVAWPAATILAVAVVFGLYAVSDGIIAAITVARAPRDARPVLFAEAFVGLAFGIVALGWPSATIRVITLLIGPWALVTGVGELLIAIRVRREIADEPTYVFFGVVSILFGLIVLLVPVHSVIALVWLIGICAGVYGFLLVAASARLKVLITGAPPPG
jgi:uncharacterized membrane protein HdeD (DUF308 family)